MYRCCHCASPIPTGLLCSQCLGSQHSSVFAVLFCNFCGGSMTGQRGTECSACETTREAKFARVTARIRKVSKPAAVESEQQPTLWAS
jgi:hypothetical protein